ncbi:hypothetical protein T484DRAFT_1860902 [Baffinella frigidus]|nr:hypothetical protein T484DRAFT_1860902 [Cryptophyta sp. CCMP2293]
MCSILCTELAKDGKIVTADAEQVVEAMIDEGNMPSRDTYFHMLSVIAEGARQTPVQKG